MSTEIGLPANLVSVLQSTEEPYTSCAKNIEPRILERYAREAAQGQSVFVLDGRRMRTWQGVFTEFAKAFHFPDYFSDNINSFFEIMRDLTWLPAQGYVLVILNSDQVLIDDKYDVGALAEYLDLIGAHWATPVKDNAWWDRGRIPFHSILHLSSESK